MTDSRVSGVHTVGVPVRDQDKAVAFYTRVLGMQKRLDVSMGNGGRWIEVAPAAGTSIPLVPAQDSAPAGGGTGHRLTPAAADHLPPLLGKNAVAAGDVRPPPGGPPECP